MKKKIIIGAGILLAIFVLFLILLGGASSNNKIVTQEELATIVSNVTCEVQDEENINYDLGTLTNDIVFDSDLQIKQYNKIIINQEKEFKSLGTTFLIKSEESITLEISLNKNGISISSTTITTEGGLTESVNLSLEEAVDFLATDEFSITFTQTTNNPFVFDTLILFFDEV